MKDMPSPVYTKLSLISGTPTDSGQKTNNFGAKRATAPGGNIETV